MSKPQKEKSLIELAREHMEQAGAKPEDGVDIPDSPVSSPQQGAAVKPIHSKPVNEDGTPKVKEHFDGKLSDAVASLLENVTSSQDWRALKLPSRGLAYVDCDESIMIKPFTFAQERKLRSIKTANQGTKIINSLIEECVEGLDYDAMTLEDKNYILFKLREISYGNDYTITAECGDCGMSNKLTVEISEVPVKYTEDGYQEPFTVTLPDSKQDVRFITPRCKDEHLLESAEKLTDNLWKFALSIGEFSEKKVLKAFFEATTVKDVAFFREQVSKNRYGMNKSMSFECADCGSVSESLIPFTETFFSVS
tara:strand:- start:148 stop:1074 length:927 start_codon:yes stop_codon:yes gene_type:complete